MGKKARRVADETPVASYELHTLDPDVEPTRVADPWDAPTRVAYLVVLFLALSVLALVVGMAGLGMFPDGAVIPVVIGDVILATLGLAVLSPSRSVRLIKALSAVRGVFKAGE
ncbi:hypothetical protein [Knoellia aerolata]|uniref:Uncharacterized protein n=1 Tax=Knoellia aerolata DSM 18566 TaxID=1385519 RepID=A0A0A0JT72_9MICO|nr:hypothetical protein [Knoellia aerolata]KGN40358.1 hypothetical protein N801_14795 [Knoellia aerolata DSM 18566]